MQIYSCFFSFFRRARMPHAINRDIRVDMSNFCSTVTVKNLLDRNTSCTTQFLFFLIFSVCQKTIHSTFPFWWFTRDWMIDDCMLFCDFLVFFFLIIWGYCQSAIFLNHIDQIAKTSLFVSIAFFISLVLLVFLVSTLKRFCREPTR